MLSSEIIQIHLRQLHLCKVCNTESIENEQHFLSCTLLWEDFILKLEKVAINGPTRICFSNRKYLYGLLNSKNIIIAKLMIKFIRYLLNMQETLIQLE